MIYTLFCQSVKSQPEKTALVTSQGERYTYEELLEKVHQWANYLIHCGVVANQRIGLMTEDEDAHVFFYLAVDSLGACYVPIDPEFPQSQLGSALKHLRLDALFCDSSLDLKMATKTLASTIEINQFYNKSAKTRANLEQDFTYIMSSSGTTGERKWIPIQGAGLFYWSRVEKHLLGLTDRDKVLSTRSPAFDARISELLRAFTTGATLFLMSRSDRKDMRKVIESCEQHQITSLLMVPSQLESAQFNDYLPKLRASGLKHLIVTGEACNWTLVLLCKQLGIHLWNAYGPTEATFGLSLLDVTSLSLDEIDKNKPVPIGKPIEPMRYTLVDGILYIDSPFLFEGYLKEGLIEQKQSKWFNTGDLFSETKDHLNYHGRANFETHLKVGGVKVSPSHIESIMNQYKASFVQCFVVVKKWLGHEKPTAYIKSDAALDKAAFLDYLKAHLTVPETPVCFPINDFPRLAPSDKIDRLSLIALKDDPNLLFFKQEQRDTSALTDKLLQDVLSIWARLFQMKGLAPNQNFFELGGDSILANQLIVLIQEKLDSSYQYSDFLSLKTPTPLAMSLALSQKCKAAITEVIVSKLIDEGDASKTTFMFPPLLGDGLSYRWLAERYARAFNANVYGLTSPALFEEKALPLSLEEEALSFYQAMKKTQVNGPYHLFGFSYGATLVWQVAVLCLEHGDTVGSLELMDGFPPEVLKRITGPAHERLLYSLIGFIVEVLNKKPYNETIQCPIYSEQKISVPNFEKAITRTIDRDLQDKLEQINFLFNRIYQEAKSDVAKRMIGLSKQHILFILHHPEPNHLLTLRPRIYQTNETQDYWNILKSIPDLNPIDKQYLFWNHYAQLARKNGVKLQASHLELLFKRDPASGETASAYWRKQHDQLFQMTDGYGPNAFYTCETHPQGYMYNLHFVHQGAEKDIKSFIYRKQLNSKSLTYHLSSELHTQEDSVYHGMLGFQFLVPSSKKQTVDAWLEKKKYSKKNTADSENQTITLKNNTKGIHLIVTWNSVKILNLSFDHSSLALFKKNTLTIPKSFLRLNTPNYPSIEYLLYVHNKQDGGIFEAIKQCSALLGQFIALLNSQLNNVLPRLRIPYFIQDKQNTICSYYKRSLYMFAKIPMNRKNFYELLEVPQTATLLQIKKAYRKLALKYHPDKAGLSSEAKFKELAQAYETLSSSQKRIMYDLSLKGNHAHFKANKTNFSSYEEELEELLRTLEKLRKNAKRSNAHASQAEHDLAEDAFKFASKFMNKDSNRHQSTVFADPTPENKKNMNEFICNDNARQLDIYLKANNFGSPSLLEDLLICAMQQGSLNVVKYLVEERNQNPNLFHTGAAFFQGSLFKYAASSGNLELVTYLLEEHKADIESQGTFYRGCYGTALSYAARKGYASIVNYLISKGANVNPEVSNSNILNRAIESGNVEVVKSLVEAGSKLGNYHLERAFELGCIEIAQYILQIRPGIKNHRYLKSSAAISVFQSGNLDLLKYLEKNQALDIAQLIKEGVNPISLICAAARSGCIEMMRYVLEDTQLNWEIEPIKNNHNDIASILGSAVKENGFYTKTMPVQTRLNLVRFLMEDKQFTLPIDKLIWLIKEDAQFCSIEMNAYLQSGLPHLMHYRSMLLTIALEGLAVLSHEELFRLYNLKIIRKGHYENFELEINSLIHKRHISVETLKELLSRNSQFRVDALFYYSNYHFNKDFSLLDMLLTSGVDINTENERGEIAIHYALRQGGYNQIVEFLIDKGADVFKKNASGRSVYDILKTEKKFQAQMEKNAEQNPKQNTHDAPNSNPVNSVNLFKRQGILEEYEQKTIAIADKPLHLGGTIQHMPVCEFEKIIGQPYMNKVDASQSGMNLSDFKDNIIGNLTAAQLKTQVEVLLKNPRQDLVLHKQNDALGFGVFASSNIPKDTVLCFYSGTLVNSLKTNMKNDEAIEYFGLKASFSTKKYRGIGSFFQHFPSKLKCPDVTMLSKILHSVGQGVSEKDLKIEEELYSIQFLDKEVEQSLAVANSRREHINFQGIPLVLLVTDSDVRAGEQLGFNYGKNYWLSRKIVPELFDKFGTVIPSSSYKRTFYQLQLNGSHYTGELLPLIQQLAQIKTQIELKDDKGAIRKIAPDLVLDELLRVHAITAEEFQSFKKAYSKPNSQMGKNLKFQTPKGNTLEISESELTGYYGRQLRDVQIDGIVPYMSFVRIQVDAKSHEQEERAYADKLRMDAPSSSTYSHYAFYHRGGQDPDVKCVNGILAKLHQHDAQLSAASINSGPN
jgi:acyl-coenzyme A synthetase/AMP-(fatty) acid ligase/curved DNA-binding protein CbpA